MDQQEPTDAAGAPLSPEFAQSIFPHPTKPGPTLTGSQVGSGDVLTMHPDDLPPIDLRLGDQPRTSPPPAALKRVLTRDIPVPPFAGKKLGRSQVEELLRVAADTGHPNQIDLRGTDLRGIDLTGMDLHGIRLGDDDPLASEEERRGLAAQLDQAQMGAVNLNGVIAPGVSFKGADLRGAHFHSAILGGANFEDARLLKADLGDARLTDANLQGAQLEGATLTGSVLVGAQMTQARMTGARLEGADLGLANLTDATLAYAYCNEQTFLGGAILQGVAIDGLHYRDVDLTATDWGEVRTLGEESMAAQAPLNHQAAEYRRASRAYRRLGLALRGQGLSSDGQRFLARAQRMEERAQSAVARSRWKERAYWSALPPAARWLGAAIQGVVVDHGAHPSWGLAWLACISFIGSIFNLITLPHHPSFGNAFLLSMANLLGRGYLMTSQSGFPVLLGLVEALLGTIILALFILALARKTLA